MRINSKADLARYLGTRTSEESDIAHSVYHYTGCGAWFHWVKLNRRVVGVDLGTIVEGSDAEVHTTPLMFPFTSTDWERTIEYVEAEAEALWNEANEYEGSDELGYDPNELPDGTKVNAPVIEDVEGYVADLALAAKFKAENKI